MKNFIIGMLCLSILQTSCNDSSTQENKIPETMPRKDLHSFAIPNLSVIKHLDLDISLNFDNKTIEGTAKYQIENATNANEIVFDTKDLQILEVNTESKTGITFTLDSANEYLGSALHIPIAATDKWVSIKYRTSANTAALQWLDAEQTEGKKHPFLFTQSQAILARTWIPVQDSPGIRFTYKAKVQAPKDLLVLMSAKNPVEKNENGLYEFEMNQPVPAYLMALSAGNITYKAVSERTGVYAEPEKLEKAAWEFADMEKMLVAAEKLYGKYAWEQYDLIVLPPSFPFGGMENPRLTFCTPTVIAGDRSLTALVAHELAHSWSGNLVTNETWEDFWLNEGFTVYFERRIMEELYGKEYTDMLAVLGHQDLLSTIEEIGAENADTKLKLNLKDRNPDDGMTDIAYEKGNALLQLLENTCGRENFDAFLNKHFSENAFKTINTEKFLENLNAQLLSQNPEWKTKIEVEKWVYQPGLPANVIVPKSQKFETINGILADFSTSKKVDKKLTANWTTHEWLHFLRNLPSDISLNDVVYLDNTFAFSKSGNSEILAAWFMHSIRLNHQPAFEPLANFLTTVGRRKFLKPLYAELIKTEAGKTFAKEVYEKARPNYHSVSRETIDAMLK